MSEFFSKSKMRFLLLCQLAVGVWFCRAGMLDTSKYIGIDEIRPGMKGYCLTAYSGTKIEKFSLDVLDVVRNVRPGRDAILVQGTDERFIHTGPVAGCSGSPVYIDDRLAGALAFAWMFSKDPVYGVTPIAEMLRTGQAGGCDQGSEAVGFVFDFSRPIDFAEIDRRIRQVHLVKGQAGYASGDSKFAPLLCPLTTSSLPAEVCERLNRSVGPLGFLAVSGVGGSSGAGPQSRSDEARLEPGACLAVPLVTGDIKLEAVGTVTEVVDDRVYAFGHSFLGYGPIDFPMATGTVHTVVSSMFRSFKFATSIDIVGALRTDESSAVVGRIGAKARMIPLRIKIDRYNDQQRLYNCELAVNRLFTPLVLRVTVAGAALMLGRLPPDHMIEYKVAIDTRQGESIRFENISTGAGLMEVVTESAVPVALLMNNPYKKVDIKSLDFDIRIAHKNVAGQIWSADLSDTKVKAGQTITASIVTESVRAGKKRYQYSLKIPEDLSPGKYKFIASGKSGYMEFLMKSARYKLVPRNVDSIFEVLNYVLNIGKDRLYCLLVLPSAGVAVERAELPDLPGTKALILDDSKRALTIQPYPHWLEKSFDTGTVIGNTKTIEITVEK